MEFHRRLCTQRECVEIKWKGSGGTEVVKAGLAAGLRLLIHPRVRERRSGFEGSKSLFHSSTIGKLVEGDAVSFAIGVGVAEDRRRGKG